MAAYELGLELLDQAPARSPNSNPNPNPNPNANPSPNPIDQAPARSPLYLPSPHLGVISLLLGLFYALLPPPRASNSAFTETCKFAGVYLGTLVAGSEI